MVRILDGQGNTVVKYAYDPWGVPTIEGDKDLAALNPCSYRGYYYDEETGYYYLQSRYYDPAIGRFLNADDVAFLGASGEALGYNLFAYCENSPINHIDATGHWIQYAVGAAIGGIMSLVFYIIDCAIARVSVRLGKAVLNFLNGAVNGIIAATGAALIWQIVASVSSGIISLFVGATQPTYEDLAIAILCGVLSGILAGTMPKSAGKHINYLMKSFGKKVSKAVFSTTFGKTLLKAAKYVFKNCSKVLWKFIKAYCIPNAYIGVAVRIKTLLGV